MQSNQHYQINVPEIIHETIDHEVLIIEFISGNYYSLSEVGAEIWDGLVKGNNLNEIITNLSHQYSGSQDEITQGVQQLITELEQEKIIVPVSKSPVEQPESKASLKLDLATDRPAFKTPILKKYTDMQELLLLDPIHEVDESGWPSTKNMISDN